MVEQIEDSILEIVANSRVAEIPSLYYTDASNVSTCKHIDAYADLMRHRRR